MSRQQAFEAIYAKQHDVPAESLAQYRFESKEGYSLPGIASHYRTYCMVMDSFDSDLSSLKSEIEDMRREIAALKPSPIRTDKTTIGYTGCIICGRYTDHGGLQCPNLAARSLSMENQRVVRAEPIRAEHPLDALDRKLKP